MSHRLEDCLPRDFDLAFPCTRFGRRGSLVPNLCLAAVLSRAVRPIVAALW